ncbi:Zinc ion binding protein [Phytophthora palmivora]|uniref:Zinc ion binding protein n=1 Tax=Phytophthora palmivora TaxID=4796 RepID=A0A2P4YI46_9STRA|nr:Zinc ion binding protein [Phytophthora palmivora]
MQQQRVLADGWGQQTSGSVFCADSSLRYIYESNGAPAPAPQQTLSYNSSAKTQPQVYSTNKSNAMTFAGKRPRDFSSENGRENGGVDLFEAEIAKTCNAIRKQAGNMPHSYRECSVCLSANAYAQISSCGHTFHPNCFLRWFRLNRSCPLCRGVVDKVQLAQAVGVQDELEAIMAEIDDEPLQLMPARGSQQLPRSETDVTALDDQLMSFLESDFDTDMELAALDDLSNDVTATGAFGLAMKREADGDETMAMELDELVDGGEKQEVLTDYAAPSNFAPVAPQQFPAASAMPNYWNVLNQGMAPPIMPPAPAVPPVVPNHQRMEGGMCGASCRCTSCKNPFLMVKAAGADIDALLKDDCFMHNVSKTRDMVVRLQEPVAVPCCESTIKVVDCVQGYTCVPCKRRFDFSWCMNKLLDSERTPRNHCAICKRCCDHRDVHCNDCGRCYFAGVAASLPCPCKEASSHKKRREAAAKDKAEEAEEEAEGECCIM